MSNTQFKLYADWNRDGDYSDTNEDLSPYVMNLNWSLGMQKWQDVAAEATLTAVLKNNDGRFNPENSSSPLYGLILPQVPILLQTASGLNLWKGWLDTLEVDWQPGGLAHGKMSVKLKASGAKRLLQQTSVRLSLQENKRADEIIGLILAQVALSPASLAGLAWILGQSGFSELGVTTYLSDPSVYSDLDFGTVIFATYGDKLPPSAYQIIDELTKAERGRFFFDREGRAVWWNRYHLLDTALDEATISNTVNKPKDLDYGYARSLLNRVTVKVYPRRAGSGITLWTLDQSLTIPPNDFVEFEAPYNDATSQNAGASGVSASGATYSAGTATISLTAQADRAIVSVQNVGSVDAILTALNVGGTAITQHNALVGKVEDSVSRAAYGLREYTLDLKALGDLNTALDVAEFMVRNRKDPFGEINALTLFNGTQNAADQTQLDLSIGSRIAVALSDIEHTQSYYIVGEKHQVSEGLRTHQTVWQLEPAFLTRLSHYYNSNADDGVDLESAASPEKTRLAQGFEVSANQTVSFVRLWLQKAGTPTGDLTLSIYSNHLAGGSWYLGVPGSSELEVTTYLASETEYPDALITNGTSDTLSAEDVDSAYGWVEFEFPTPPSLTAGSKYWLVLSTSDSADASNYVQWGADSSSPTYRSRFLFGRAAGIWASLDKIGCYQMLNSQSDVVSQFASGYQDDHGQLNALAAGGATIFSTADTTNSRIGDFAARWPAQSFIPDYSGTLSKITINLTTSVGSPVGDIVWQLRTDSGGSPSSTILDSGVFTPVAASVNVITVSGGVFLANGVTYWIVLLPETIQTVGNYWRIRTDGAMPYANGEAKQTVNDGASWTVSNTDWRASIETTSASTRDKLAQGIRLDGVSKIATVKLWLRKVGSPTGNLTVMLCRDDTNNPGAVIATAATVAASTLSSSYGWITFTFDNPPTLATDQLYWIVIETSDSASGNAFVEWGAAWGQTSYPGWMLSEQDGWFRLENKDAIFEVYH